jgi:signal transduction histidine kinase
MDRVLHLVFTGVFASVACFLAERERKNRQQAEQERYLAGIGQVATVIVHDLKNPLISILGFARRIREGKGDVALGAQTIEDSAQNMQSIVNSVLDFVKPLQLDIKDVDIRDTIRLAGESCRTKAAAKSVTLTMHLPSAPVTTAIDNFHIERALVNLIDNAVDASQPGALVTITAAIDRNYIAITIKDQGTGMDRETLSNLFMPFYTAKNEGTGLGMPISRKVIEAHAGTLGINSKQGVGTEAAIRLPYKK